MKLFLVIFCALIFILAVVVPIAIFYTSETNLITTTTLPVSTATVTGMKILEMKMFVRTNERLFAVWNTSAGGDSTSSFPGTDVGSYWPDEPVEAVFDTDINTDYCHFGICGGNEHFRDKCGAFTGFYFTLSNGSFILVQFQMAASRTLYKRDPLTITIEGSNENQLTLTRGSSWTLIYSGTTGLTDNFERPTFGRLEMLSNSTIPFRSFRFLVTSKRSDGECVMYSEVRMFGFFISSEMKM